MKTVLLSSAYLAPIEYYTKLYTADRILVERYDHYIKQTYRNRCVIVGANGTLSLTIPEITSLANPSCMTWWVQNPAATASEVEQSKGRRVFTTHGPIGKPTYRRAKNGRIPA